MLDAVDAGLVRGLQGDGRASFQSLSQLVGISREAARARVQRLLDQGRVRVVGVVAPEVAGLTALAHVSLDVAGPTIAAALVAAARPAARFVSCTAGPHAVVADVRVADADALEEECALLRQAPGVRGIEVFTCADLVKDAYAPTGPAAGRCQLTAADLDRIDRLLLELLQRDGRASFSALSEQVGLSQPATRARVLRLLEAGAVYVTGLVATAALGVREAAGIGLGVRAGARQVAGAAARLPGVNYVALGHGRFDVVCGVDARDRAELLAGLEALRALPGVARSESWVHLEIVKESYTYDLPVG